MEVFDRFAGHEQVVFGADEESGLRCIVAIHSTTLGPGLGGTRFRPYAGDDEALTDVLRLSRAMTYKAACAGLAFGGGKAVIIGDPEAKTEVLLRAYGRFLDSLGGRYITACDVGTYPEDMDVVAEESRWVTGRTEANGGAGDSGILTAYGVFRGMQAAAEHRWGRPSLTGRHVAVQGLGKVGRRLVADLVADGARVTVADVDAELTARVAQEYGAAVADPADIHRVAADVFSPNALGGVLHEGSIPELGAEVVCGGANNQLGTDGDADLLRQRGVLYAPDYVVNSGGLITVADELHPGGHSEERARRKVEGIAGTLAEVFAEAEATGVSTEVAAERVAERRIDAGSPVSR